MIKVQVRPNEPLETALRRFKRQCNYAGIFRMAKKYAYFEKESDRKRREDRDKIRNIQRLMRKSEDRGRGRARPKSKVKRVQATGEETSGEQVSAVETAPAASTPAASTPAASSPAASSPAASSPAASSPAAGTTES